MKEPSSPISCSRKKPSSELRLVCSFHGACHVGPPSDKHSYIGGERRVVHVERNVSFSKLRSKIAYICHNVNFFCLKYQLPVYGCDRTDSGDNADAVLVSVESDEDVRCMIEEYNKLERYGGHAWLWVFVCGEYEKGQSSETAEKGRYYGFDDEQDFSYITPWSVNCDSVETSLAPISRGNQNSTDGNPVTSSCFGDLILSGCSVGMQNQRFGVSDSRNRGICPYNERSHTNSSVDQVENQGAFYSEGHISVGKCNYGINPTSKNSAEEQSVQSYDTNLLKPSKNLTAIESCLNKGNFSFDEQYGDSIIGYGNSKMEEWDFGYCSEGQVVGDQYCLSFNADKIPTSCAMVFHTQEDLLTGSDYTLHSSNLENLNYPDELEESNNRSCLSDNVQCSDRTTSEGNVKNGNEILLNGAASSVNLLHQLSLSSSNKIDASEHFSRASSIVCEALTKPQSQPSDTMDETQFIVASHVDQVNRATSKSGSIDVNEGIGKNIRSCELEFVKELGSGAYGTVFYGKWKGSDVAIKKIKPSCLTGDSKEEGRLVKDFWREAYILGQLHHPNIVALYGVVTDGPVTNLAVVTEYMVNGSLKQVLRRKDRTIDFRKRLMIAMDAAVGMEYLHEHKIVHFDLKSDNFLVNMRDPQRPVCKIGDLGLSKIQKKTLISGGIRGTLPWMAPELLNKDNLVTEKIDVYSYGIVMWELLTGDEPYGKLRSKEIIAGIINGSLRPEIPLWCNPSWRSLMERCWSSDPNSRPSFSEIVKELCAMAAALKIK